MSDLLEKLGIQVSRTTDQGFGLLDKLIAIARSDAAFSSPVTVGDYAVITASEVSCGLGVGFGGGGGSAGDDEADGGSSTEEPADDRPANGTMTGSGVGVGGGGGGFSTARPVAAISIGPDGVHVEPVVDATKVAIAFFSTLGAMAMMWNRLRRVRAA
jgi:uncharacterized spore protein YtfJ